MSVVIKIESGMQLYTGGWLGTPLGRCIFTKRPSQDLAKDPHKVSVDPMGSSVLGRTFIDIPDDNKRSGPLHSHILIPLQGLQSGNEEEEITGWESSLWLMGNQRFRPSVTASPIWRMSQPRRENMDQHVLHKMLGNTQVSPLRSFRVAEQCRLHIWHKLLFNTLNQKSEV